MNNTITSTAPFAFLCGLQTRCGANSPIACIGPLCVRDILELAFPDRFLMVTAIRTTLPDYFVPITQGTLETPAWVRIKQGALEGYIKIMYCDIEIHIRTADKEGIEKQSFSASLGQRPSYIEIAERKHIAPGTPHCISESFKVIDHSPKGIEVKSEPKPKLIPKLIPDAEIFHMRAQLHDPLFEAFQNGKWTRRNIMANCSLTDEQVDAYRETIQPILDKIYETFCDVYRGKRRLAPGCILG